MQIVGPNSEGAWNIRRSNTQRLLVSRRQKDPGAPRAEQPCRMRNAEDIRALVERAVEHFGRIDCLVKWTSMYGEQQDRDPRRLTHSH